MRLHEVCKRLAPDGGLPGSSEGYLVCLSEVHTLQAQTGP